MSESRVVVAMSGGVDSSVAAAFLKGKGYDVIGMTMKLWGKENRCCSDEDVRDAQRVAQHLGIPHYIVSFNDAFKTHIVDYFVSEYRDGRTPNPCINCNKYIRWGFLQSRARALSADFIATGHYARIRQGQDGKYQLIKNPDPEKDQSYFLHILSQEDLRSTIFPLGDLNKSEVRRLAEKYRLTVATRPDSQDLCFVGQGDYRDFLRKMDPSAHSPGPIYDLNGKELGKHTGLADYTIGQRKGLGVAGPEPYYVIRKELKGNALIVGYKSSLGRAVFYVKDPNWISGESPAAPINAEIKIRYRSSSVPGKITPLGPSWYEVSLDRSLPDITPGQAVVFYQEDICLGGGAIHWEEE